MASKKGMGIAQTFIFIVAALTFALIMVFGYKAVQDFVSNGEDVVFIQFKNDLESSVAKVAGDYGAVRIVDFTVPARYEQICFVDLDVEPTKEMLAELRLKDGYASDVWEEAWLREDLKGSAAADSNVFLVPREGTVPIKLDSFQIFSEKDEKGFLCTPVVKRSFTLVIEGKGSRAEISLPESS